MRAEGSVASEGRLFAEQKIYSWGRCTMVVANMHSD